MCIAVLTLDAALLASSQYPEGPATGHLDTDFLVFPVSTSECSDGSQVSKSLLHASHVALQTYISQLLISYLCTCKITTATG